MEIIVLEKQMQVLVTASAMAGGTPELDELLLRQIFFHGENLITRRGVPENCVPEFVLACSGFDYYVGQVLNGGHSQFVGNAGSQAKKVLANMVYLFDLAGLVEYAALARIAKTWVSENPEEASNQTGFSGGIAEELEALDVPFYTLHKNQPPLGPIADALRARPELLSVESTDNEVPTKQRTTLANEWISQTPAVRHHIARKVAQQVREWFSDPMNVGLALAAGWENAPIQVAETIGVSRASPTEAKGTAIFIKEYLDEFKKGAFKFELSETGLLVEPFTDVENFRSVHVPIENIRRVQELAEEFRLPESVGLRWWQMGVPFSANRIGLYEHPKWEPGKFWLRWMGRDWGVKGSPEKSTFVDLRTFEPESLSQAELQRMAAEAGIASAKQATS